jgi:hypothetical protein
LTGFVVSLGTDAGGQLISTAFEVSRLIFDEAIHWPGGGGIGASIWPGTTGAGIVAPAAPRALTRLSVYYQSLSGVPRYSTYSSLPGRVLLNIASGGTLNTTEPIVAHLDSDDDGVVDPGELVTPADVTWVDLTPPVVTVPYIEVPATSPAGATVNYVATAVDAVSGPAAVSCTIPSGATFPVGFTFVTCTATDAAGNEGAAIMTVWVTPFVPPATSVDLVSPIGGERLFVNVPVTIRWNATGAATSFDVLLSRGPSDPFSPVCANLPGTATSCNWVPSGSATSQARIRVIASDSMGTATDTSGAFTIATGLPSLTVTSPAWPTTWAVGTTQAIRWQHNLGASASFRLEVSRDWGGSWEVVAGSVPSTSATTGSFSWTVTAPAAPYALIRATWTGGPVEDSDLVAIEVPRITVTDSNGGDTWTIGSARTIRWNHNLGANQMVAVELSRDGGATWSPVAASTPSTGATSGQLAWTVTGPVTSRARIRVRWLANPAVGDQSDGDFTIASRIRVTSPNSAVAWVVGSVHPVRWTHQHGLSQLFDIDFSADGGASWSSFATGVPAATATSGTYSAAMPMTATTQALFRVSPAGVPGDGDTSDVPFTLR